MKSTTRKVFIIAMSIFIIMMVAGCEEQNLSNTKRDRLFAAENIQLKKQLEQCGQEIERQKGLVSECQQEKKAMEEAIQKTQTGSQDLLSSILEDVEDENIRLFQENRKLKVEIEELKKELEGANKQAGS